MYCKNCGAKLHDGDTFCDLCGTAVTKIVSEPKPSHAVATPSRNFGGYSQRVDSDEMKAYLAMQRRWRNLFLCLVVIAPIVGFCIYALCSQDITISEALMYGPIVSLIMFCFGIYPTIKQKLQKPYIGTVIEKRDKLILYDEDDAPDRTKYYIVTRDTNGKKHTHKSTGYEGIYRYLKIGDEIRFLPQFPAPFEKKKEPNDTHTCCVFCQSIVSLDDDICPRCKAPVLK